MICEHILSWGKRGSHKHLIGQNNRERVGHGVGPTTKISWSIGLAIRRDIMFKKEKKKNAPLGLFLSSREGAEGWLEEPKLQFLIMWRAHRNFGQYTCMLYLRVQYKCLIMQWQDSDLPYAHLINLLIKSLSGTIEDATF